MTSSLMDPSPARTGIPSVNGFLLWLWPLTAAPQRSFRANAMWLHKHLAALQSSGRQAGGPKRAASAMSATQANHSRMLPVLTLLTSMHTHIYDSYEYTYKLCCSVSCYIDSRIRQEGRLLKTHQQLIGSREC